jgi:hypothetical protein
MRRTILVLPVLAVALAGCGRHVHHETVVERPVVTKETIVERQVPAQTIVTAPMHCSLGSIAYASGSMSCQAAVQHRCVNGNWERIVNSVC